MGQPTPSKQYISNLESVCKVAETFPGQQLRAGICLYCGAALRESSQTPSSKVFQRAKAIEKKMLFQTAFSHPICGKASLIFPSSIHLRVGVPKSHENKKSQDWDFLGINPRISQDFLGFFKKLIKVLRREKKLSDTARHYSYDVF